MKIHQDSKCTNRDFKGLASPLQVRARKRRARRVLQQHYRNLLAGGRLIVLRDTSER